MHNTLYKKLLCLAKLKLVALLQTSEFPLEIPRSQNRNFQYTNSLPFIGGKRLEFNNLTQQI
jgi:hypothetical protein